MCRCLIRYTIGLLMFAAGLFWAPLIILGITFALCKRGPFCLFGLFFREKYECLPEIARKRSFVHSYLRTKSGVRFHYVHAGSTDNQLLICLHGFPECWYSYHHVLEHYKDKYYVVAVDMRGYGESDKPRSIGKYHKDYLMRDVQQIIYALGYKTATIVGNGTGGSIAWELPYYFPGLVDRMVIINAPDRKGFRKYLCKYPCTLLSYWHFFVFQLPFLAEIFFKVNNYKVMERLFNGCKYGIRNCENKLTDVELGIYKCIAGEDITYPLNYFRAMNPLYTGLGFRRKDSRIRIPVLIIWGMQDAIHDHKMVPHMEEYCDYVRVHQVDNCSHWVTLDQPEEMLGVMDEFFAEPVPMEERISC